MFVAFFERAMAFGTIIVAVDDADGALVGAITCLLEHKLVHKGAARERSHMGIALAAPQLQQQQQG